MDAPCECPMQNTIFINRIAIGLSKCIQCKFYNAHYFDFEPRSILDSFQTAFLPRDSYAKRGICRRRVSLCVSVCVCVCVCVCLSHSGIV